MLRGRSSCFRTVGPALLVRVLTERAGVFLFDHCQVGFAAMFTMWNFLFLLQNEKNPRPCEGLGFGWVQPSELYMREISVDSAFRW